MDEIAAAAGIPRGQHSTMGGGILVLTCFYPTSSEAHALQAAITAAHPGIADDAGVVPSPSQP